MFSGVLTPGARIFTQTSSDPGAAFEDSKETLKRPGDTFMGAASSAAEAKRIEFPEEISENSGVIETGEGSLPNSSEASVNPSEVCRRHVRRLGGQIRRRRSEGGS